MGELACLPGRLSNAVAAAPTLLEPRRVMRHRRQASRTFRLGGLVPEGSIKRDGTEVRFAVTDTAQTVAVQYTGLLADLFKEGNGMTLSLRSPP